MPYFKSILIKKNKKTTHSQIYLKLCSWVADEVRAG